MILDIETFELWMSKIMERFDRHERMLCTLTGKEVKEAMYVDGETPLGQSGFVPAPANEQAVPATLPQFGDAALSEAAAQNLLH